MRLLWLFKTYDTMDVFCPWVPDPEFPGQRWYVFGTPQELMHRRLVEEGWKTLANIQQVTGF